MNKLITVMLVCSVLVSLCLPVQTASSPVKAVVQSSATSNVNAAVADGSQQVSEEGEEALLPQISSINEKLRKHCQELLHAASSVQLSEGTAFVALKKNILLRAPHAAVIIAANAIAYVVMMGDTLSVYNITDYHDGDVAVITEDGAAHALRIGHQLLLTSSGDSDFDSQNPTASVETQNAIELNSHSSSGLYEAEFKICSLLDQAPEFSSLSRKNAHDRELAARIFKTVAILETAASSN